MLNFRAFAVILSATSLFGADVAGTWQGQMVSQNTKYGKPLKSSLGVTLAQSGTTLTGQMIRNGKSANFSSGVESNGSLTLVYRGVGETGTFRLARTGSKLTGTVTTDRGFRADVDLTLKLN